MFENDKEIMNGWKALGYAAIFFFLSSKLAGLAFVGIAIYFGISGFAMLLSEGAKETASSYPRTGQIPPTTSAPITDEPTIADKIKAIHVATGFKCPSCGAPLNPTDMKCKSCGSYLVASANLPKPNKWGEVEIGQSIQMMQPSTGKKLIAQVVRRIYYGELWQTQMRPHVPWTLTGGYFVGLGLENNLYLLNWQSRFYLLDSRTPLTDMEITRDFAPYARKFAASNQTASVFFEYKGTDWRIDDIGRFRIEFADGEGTQVGSGAVGRFIDASNANRVLIIEDYQSGGSGLDTLWQGYRIEEKDIEF